MALIDHRILITAPSEAVWVYLTDTAHLNRWNRGAKQISILTTKLSGIGVRRRCTGVNGESVVEEITAWLENIGYEYRAIESHYKRYQGRMRLQPLPEGTLVSWELDYEVRPPLAGLRDTLRRRPYLNRMMIESLRALKQLVERSGIKLDPERQKKFAMQPDPGVAVRQARMTEPTTAMNTPTPPGAPITPFSPPPVGIKRAVNIVEDDVPPLPAPSAPTVPMTPISPVTLPPKPTTPQFTPPPPITPSIVATRAVPPPLTTSPKIVEPPLTHEDTKPSIAAPKEAITAFSNADSSALTVPIDLVAPKTPPPQPQTLPEPPTMTQPIPIPPTTIPPPTTKTDTGEMSIWDVFGMEKPSEGNKRSVDEIVNNLRELNRIPDELPLTPSRVSPTPPPVSQQKTPPSGLKRLSRETAEMPISPPYEEPPPLPTDPVFSEPPRPASRSEIKIMGGLFEKPSDAPSAETKSVNRTRKVMVKIRQTKYPTRAKAMIKVRKADSL
jgi:hypothetical protein